MQVLINFFNLDYMGIFFSFIHWRVSAEHDAEHDTEHDNQ